MKINFKLIIFFCFFFISTVLFSQLAEWKFYRDRDENTYFIDRNGKIWTSTKPVFKYKAVSLQGINYYLSHAKGLIHSFYYSEGLTILKSILAMPVDNDMIRKAQIDAVQIIHQLKKKNGIRYNRLNEDASVILFKRKKKIILVNDLMKYEFPIDDKFEIIRKKVKSKYRYKYQGITIGIQSDNSKKSKERKYKYLIAMDSEKFTKKVESVNLVEKSWRVKLGFENFIRKKIVDEKNNRIYVIENNLFPFIKGYEGFFVNGKYTHIIRIISSKDSFMKNKKDMKNSIVALKLL